MARMPGATWRPVPNRTPGGQDSVLGVVLHIMEGTLDGSDSWFRNSASQASAHFGVGKDGVIYQWVDTADRAWAQVAGNRTWLSIEHEGHSGDSLTAAQLAATARIVAWAHTAHGVPLQSTDLPYGRGIGWHGMGGAAWGGHTDCPGTPIKNQRAAIIAAAKGGAVTSTQQEEDVPLTDAEIAKVAAATRDLILTRKTDNPTTSDDSTLDLLAMLWDTGKNAGQANANSAKLVALVQGQTAAIEVLASKVGSGDDVATVVKAVQDAIAAAVVKVDVSVGDNTPQRES